MCADACVYQRHVQVIVHNGEMLQLQIGTLVAAIFVFVQVMAAPYKQLSDDYLASASSFSLLVLLLTSLGFKYATLVELPDILMRMSWELLEFMLTAVTLVRINVSA